MIPSTLALVLRFDGWVVRNDIIWSKPNSMPASVKDRLTNRHEHIWFLVKGKRPEDSAQKLESFLQVLSTLDIAEPHRYYFDLDSIRVPHKTQSLERYQRGVNQKAFGKPYEGKFTGVEDQVEEKGGMQASALRRGISVNPPKWFEEGMPPDRNYKGKFDGMGRHHGSGPQNRLTGLGRAGDLLLLERQGSKANNLDLKVSHQNRNFMSYRPRHYELLSDEDRTRVLEALKAGLRVDIVTVATAASIRANDSGRAKEIEEKGYAIYINHPLGGNPGDVIQTGKYLENPSPGGRSHIRMGKEFAKAFEDGTALHPLGRNPGDVIQDEDWWGQDASRKDRSAARPLIAPNNPWGNRAGGGDNEEKHGQAIELTPKEQFYKEHGGTRKPMCLIRDVRHPAGKNPGDVVSTLKGHRGKETDPNLGGHAALEEYLYRCRAEGRSEGHPLGKNPGDVIYPTDSLHRYHSRSGSHQEARDTCGCHSEGKNPGDVVQSTCEQAEELNRRRGKLRSDGTVAGHYLDLPDAAKHYAEGGKNPGDVVETGERSSGANTGVNNKEPYQQNNPHLARLKYGHDAGHPEGKNPGDVVKDFDRTMEKSAFAPPHRPARFRESDFQQDGNYPSYPEGKNPGDIVKGRGPDTEGRPLRPPHHPFRGEGWEASNPDMGPHPLGANPGDVMKGKKFQHNIGAVQHREGMDGIVAPLHPLGHNPGDVAGDTEGGEGSFRNVAEVPDFWEYNTRPFPGAHFAVFPEAICLRPILSSSRPGDIVLDPFCGAGTALAVAKKLGRKAIGIDLVPEYCQMSKEYVTRLKSETITCRRDGSQVLYTKDMIQHAKSNPEKNDVCLGRVPFEIGGAPCRNCQRGKLLTELNEGGEDDD